MLDFEHTLLESENAETDFSELSVELEQDVKDYFSSHISRTSHTITSSSSSEKTEKNVFVQAELTSSLTEYEGLPSKKLSQSEEYIKRHVEEISDRFYRTLFGDSYVSPQPSKLLTTETFLEYERVEVVHHDDVDQVTVTSSELSPEILAHAISSAHSNFCVTPEDDFTEKSTASTLTQMSLDSTTIDSESPKSNFLSTEHRVEIAMPIILTKPEDAECTNPKYTTSISAEVVALTPVSLASQFEFRSLSPDSGSEYVDNFEMTLLEYRSSSPESVVSVSLDSPLPFEYRPSSPDSCILMAGLRASSPESISSVNDWMPLNVDSPLPDFRPTTPLPTAFETPEFTRYIEEYKPSSSHGEERPTPAENTKHSPGACFMVVTNDTERPVSPSSVMSWPSVSPESDGSWSPFGSESLDLESCSERSYERCTPSPNAFLPEIRPSSPESIASVNEYSVLSPDSPIPCFSSAVHYDSLTYRRYRSPSLQSDMSDQDFDCLSLKCLVGSRPSSPESAASLNEDICLSPDSPLPSFIQTMCECFIPAEAYRSESSLVESSLSNGEDHSLSAETRPSSPESFASIHDHRPLSPDSPIPEFPHINVITFESCRNSSPDLETSDIEYSQCELIFTEPRPESPESIISEPEYNIVSKTVVESFIVEGETAEKTISKTILVKPIESVYDQESKENELSEIGQSDEQKYTLVYKAELSNRIAKVFDPQYKGETFCTKPGIFEFTRDMGVPEVAKTLTSTVGQAEVLSGSEEKYSQDSHEVEADFKYTAMTQYESVLSESHPEDRPMSPESSELNYILEAVDCRPVSPESTASVDENRPLSPDSPIPQYFPTFIELIPVTEYRSLSSESAVSELDLQTDVFDDVVVDLRRSSLESITSFDELRPLSPDSPVPQYTPLLSQITVSISGHRSCSPESVCSEIAESEELLTLENRPDSPDSILSETDKKSLSPDSVTEWRPMSPETVMLLNDIRGSSPQSDGSINECRPLSPDSPVPQYFPRLFELIPVTDYRSSSPESAASELDLQTDIFNDVVVDVRRSSLESITSVGENRPLSPDSPIPQYFPTFIELIPVTDCRSSSPESAVSELDLQTDVFDDVVVDLRRSSLESITSVDENRPLSPDSPIPQYFPTVIESIPVTEYRSSSPESAVSELDLQTDVFDDVVVDLRRSSLESITSVDELRPLSPDSPIPQFTSLFSEFIVSISGHRSCSPESVCSETAESELSLEELLTLEHRPNSPDSVLSETDKRSLSPDSVTEWRPMSPESVMLLNDIRGSSPQSDGSINECRPLSPDSPVPQYFPRLFELIPVTDCRSSSPESAASELDLQTDVFDDVVVDLRRSSLESITSVGENRPLSPDSPIPQYFPTVIETIPVTEHRSSSPESAASELDLQTDVFNDVLVDVRRSSLESITSVDENRPLSPDSPIPQYFPTVIELIPVTDFRSSSPESAASELNLQTDVYDDVVVDLRRSSLESITSVDELRPLSPDSPVPQYTPLLSQITVSISGHRSCSPESVCSETAESELSLEELLTLEHRPNSPDSVLSETDKRSLSPDSVTEWRPMSPESVMLLNDIRGSSPQSDGSINECRPLSPDSPVPQYFPGLFELIPVTDYRSISSESAASGLNLQTDVFDDIVVDLRRSSLESITSVGENRPLSPDSPVPQYFPRFFELIPVTEHRSSSPESAGSELDLQTDVFDDVVVDLRRSSLEAITSDDELRPLSPDSPIPQYFPTVIESIPVTDFRSSSPESAVSELDLQTNVFDDVVLDLRRSSLESIISVGENRPLSPDSPIPQYFPKVIESIPVTEYRSSSPESAGSELDLQTDVFDDVVVDLRRSSLESITSVGENRPLSPDSPIPQYFPTFIESIPVTDCRSSSPESAGSELDLQTDVFDDIVVDLRRSSLESITSVGENRPLSPDSPIPQYFPTFIESIPVTDCRSSSPESAVSELDLQTDVFDDVVVDLRRSSLESITSVDELRPLSPDSPIPQYFPTFIESIPVTDCRSSSPESAVSELDLQTNVFDDVVLDLRRSSLESIISVGENRPLSPDSPIPQYFPKVIESIPVTDCRSSSPESAVSELDLQTDVFDDVVVDLRRSSLESITSVDENRPLSPDSPIPQYFPTVIESIPVTEYRSSSPESAVSELDLPTDVFDDVVVDLRRSSLESITSVDELRPLSPDSPIPQFTSLFSEFIVSISGHRSCSPQSVCSETAESEISFEELPTLEHRPDSPDSVLSETDKRSLSPDSVTEWRPMSPESVMLLNDIRGSSPQSDRSINECRPLSPDSPVPQYFPGLFELIPVTDYRSSSPESAVSEEEYELNVFTFESLDDHRSLSSDSPVLAPDSPVPQFYSSHIESIVTDYRSSSPESAASELDLQTDIFNDVVVDVRRSSLESITSVGELRPLSPDSPIPQYFPRFFELIPVTDCRSSSPESAASELDLQTDVFDDIVVDLRRSSLEAITSDDELRPLSPDSPIPQYFPTVIESIPVTDFRSSSPESAVSELDLQTDVFDDVVVDLRRSSLESITSVDENRPLSPDSPIPQYFPTFIESIPVTDCRSSSPESAGSELDLQTDVFDDVVVDLRRSSLESIISVGENRPLSPDSPIPQYFPTFIESIPVTDCRSSSPESAGSELDLQTDVFDDVVVDLRRSSLEAITSDDELRPLSPDSPIPQYFPTVIESIPVTEYRSSSPESAVSELDLQTDVFDDVVVDLRRSSLESITSVDELRPLSPDSPIPQFTSLFSEFIVSISGHRSCSPQSVCSETAESEISLEELITLEHRPDSPDSVLSETDKRSLSPDSVTEWRPMSPESVMLLNDIRGSSPQSDGSINECRPLSPDSPVPQYFPRLFELIPVTDYRSSSPESAVSEEEFELNVFTSASLESLDDHRSLSSDSPVLAPDSPVPQFYSSHIESIVTDYRSSSPESAASELDLQTDVFDDVVVDLRRSSLESITSVDELRPLSPDSPIPQYFPTFIESIPVTDCRSSSPESAGSELDLQTDVFDDVVVDLRRSSLESITSVDENRPLSPDSPIPQYFPTVIELIPVTDYRSSSPESAVSEEEYELNVFTSASFESLDDHRSLSSDSPVLAPDSPVPQFYSSHIESIVTDYRSSSPESAASELDLQTDLFNDVVVDVRRYSLESITSIDELRPLSPDSPVPEFTPSTFSFIMSETGSRSASPESVCLSGENEYLLSDFNPEQRSDSPVSRLADIEGRPLSPDSPVPQFSFNEVTSVSICRSDSKESIVSDADVEVWVFEPQSTEQRPSSPESIISLNEKRPLSPDSPISDFKSLVCVNVTQVNTHRSSSLESITSDVDFDMASIASEGITWTENRALSPESGEVSPADPYCLKSHETVRIIPQYKLVYKAVPSALISHVYDPQYKGETFCSKPGVFENAGYTVERIKTRSETEATCDECVTQNNSEITVSEKESLSLDIMQRSIQTHEQAESVDLFEESQALSPDSLSEYAILDECIMNTSDRRASSPESYTSVTENRQLSPESPVPEHRPSVPYTEILVESRHSSPESVMSVNEFQRLSPDSPLPAYLTPSPVPYEFTCECSMVHESVFSPLSQQVLCDVQDSDLSSMFEPRSLSPVSDISDSHSRSLSPQSFCFESELRFPSPEATALDKDLTETDSPEPFVFETFYPTESPESAIEADIEEFIDNVSQLSIHETEGRKKDDLSLPTRESSLLNLVTFEQVKTQTESLPETEGQPISKIERSSSEELKPSSDQMTSKDSESVVKTSAYCEDWIINTTTDASASETSGESFIRDKRHSESPHEEHQASPDESQERDSVTKIGVHVEPQEIDLVDVRQEDTSSFISTITTVSLDHTKNTHDDSKVTGLVHQIQFTAFSQTRESDQSVSSIPEQTIVSAEEHKESTGFQELNPFQFYLKDSHRRVTPNLINLSQLSSSLESADHRNVLTRSVMTPSYKESNLVLNQSESSLVSPRAHSPVAPLTPCALEVHQELKATKTPTILTDDQKKLDASAVLDVDSPLDSVDLKTKARLARADSVESEPEFFDCRQTFSDASEPETGAGELLDVPQMVYQVEEPLSLPCTPDHLTKLRELKRDERPLSWSSEDLELPIVFEPEEEGAGEFGEEKDFPYSYTGDHSFAEELPPREEMLYDDDDDDDSLGRCDEVV
ncbi:uncharacterized protein [Misgurnus anguillicaudatus]|uniref:uncharacterized protein n=1 Tax=Misgurnus anguillicaudatus TaxID=75329 RepID=UPI003CCFD7DD